MSGPVASYTVKITLREAPYVPPEGAVDTGIVDPQVVRNASGPTPAIPPTNSHVEDLIRAAIEASVGPVLAVHVASERTDV